MYRTLCDLLPDKLNLAPALYVVECIYAFFVQKRFSDFDAPILQIYLFGTSNYFFFDIYTYTTL